MQRQQFNPGSTSVPGDSHEAQRVAVNLNGRYMLEDRSEYACLVTEMSSDDLVATVEQAGREGERVIAYIDHVGRIEGTISNRRSNGFTLSIIASERKRDKLSAQLGWLANRLERGLPEDRKHERVVPRNPYSILSMNDGREYRCKILDLSLSGAAIEIEVRPGIGTRVTLGNMQGRIMRHFEEGVAIEFATVQSDETIRTILNS
ncbi:MAG: PilZ domain-containing protein [Phyllobacterium sp.]